MTDLRLIQNTDGLEFHIDESSQLVYASVRAVERMLETGDGTVRKFLLSPAAENYTLKTAKIQTARGLQGAKLLSAEQVFKLALKYNISLAERMGSCGANIFMLGLAGYKIQTIEPKTRLQLAKEQVTLLEEIDRLQQENILLEEENLELSEVIDELFDFSSIIRIAKYNNVSETLFNWRKLKVSSKALNIEVKRVPCPRFEFKNLYSHDVWRLAYPEYKLPETTTLVIQASEPSLITRQYNSIRPSLIN